MSRHGFMVPKLCPQSLKGLSKFITAGSIGTYAPESILIRVLSKTVTIRRDFGLQWRAHLHKFSISSSEQLRFQVRMLREFVPQSNVHLKVISKKVHKTRDILNSVPFQPLPDANQSEHRSGIGEPPKRPHLVCQNTFGCAPQFVACVFETRHLC